MTLLISDAAFSLIYPIDKSAKKATYPSISMLSRCYSFEWIDKSLHFSYSFENVCRVWVNAKYLLKDFLFKAKAQPER